MVRSLKTRRMGIKKLRHGERIPLLSLNQSQDGNNTFITQPADPEGAAGIGLKSQTIASPYVISTHDLVREKFDNPVKSRAIENRYAAQLRRVAKQIGMLIEGWNGEVQDLPQLRSQLQRYADVLTPWAKATVGRIGAELIIKERKGWAAHARLMGRQMRYELEMAPTGVALQQFMNRQVELIRSLPIEAGDRVHALVLESMIEGTRARELAKEVMATEKVTRSRANLIARTEISTASTSLTRARAQSIGSEQYIWRTSRDSMVRKSHKQMEGRVCRWDEPPNLSDGTVCHAGQIYNCRCWAEPIIPGLGIN